MGINKGVALSMELLASVSSGIAQKSDTSQCLTKSTIQDMIQERKVYEGFKRAIGLIVFALSSISVQSFEAAFPYSGVPELSQMARSDPQRFKDLKENRLKAGVYFCHLEMEGKVGIRKLVLL